MSKDSAEDKRSLVKLIQNAIEQDNALRDQYQMGDKFRFIRDRLQALLQNVETHFVEDEALNAKTKYDLSTHEQLVYVYLYNAQGIQPQTWQKMLLPNVFYEHSINRPVYADKAGIESYLRTKTNQAQQGYIAIAVKSENILQRDLKDAQGNAMVKVKEGAFQFDKMDSFTTNGQTYEVNANGELVLKD